MFSSNTSANPSGITFTSTDISPTYNNIVNIDEPSWQLRGIRGATVIGSTYYITGARQFVTGSYCTAISTNGLNWTVSNSLGAIWSTVTPDGQELIPIVFGNGVFVVGTKSGRLATSSDGITWIDRDSLRTNANWGATRTIASIAFNGTFFVAAGFDGRIATSSDGITWVYQGGLRTTAWGTSRVISSIKWHSGPNIFIVTGNSGGVATSPDAITWTYLSDVQTIFGTTVVNNSFYGGSKFWLLGNSSRMVTSTDGITWVNDTNISSRSTSTNLRDMAFNGTTYLLLGSFSNFAMFRSTDGISWTNYNTPDVWFPGQTGADANFCFWDGSKWFMASRDYSLIATNTTSAFTGSGWTGGYQLSSFNDLTSEYVDGSNVFVGTASGVIYRYNTINGQWGYISSLKNTAWGSGSVNAIIKAGSLYVAVGSNSSVATSTDGVNWTYNTGLITAFGASNVNMLGLAFGNGIFMACGNSGRVATSTDGVNWTNRTTALTSTSFSTNSCNGIAFGGGRFLIVGSNLAATTTDGVSFTTTTVASGLFFRGTTWDGTRFVVVGNTSVATSTDGTTWTQPVSISNSQTLMDVAYNGSEYVVVNNNGSGGTANQFIGSTDTQSWVLGNAGLTTYTNFNKVAALPSSFIAIATRMTARLISKN